MTTLRTLKTRFIPHTTKTINRDKLNRAAYLICYELAQYVDAPEDTQRIEAYGDVKAIGCFDWNVVPRTLSEERIIAAIKMCQESVSRKTLSGQLRRSGVDFLDASNLAIDILNVYECINSKGCQGCRLKTKIHRKEGAISVYNVYTSQWVKVSFDSLSTPEGRRMYLSPMELHERERVEAAMENRVH